MVKLAEFSVERWMDLYENDAQHNLAETCCASISLNDILQFSGASSADVPPLIDFSRKQTYGAIRGSAGLRANIAKLYQAPAGITAEQVLVTTGAIHANFLALYTQVGPGDHVICHYPTYQQLYSVPESLGAEVSLWRSSAEKGWALDLQELRGLIRANTKVIILNNPQNPTGAVVHRDFLRSVVEIAREHNLIVHCDEVYRPMFHSLPQGETSPPSILEFDYENLVSTGSMSKAFSLAGLRIGWIASRNQSIIEACASSRDYTLISVSQVDDEIATRALGSPCVENLLSRNLDLARTNLDVLATFLKEFSWAVQWVRPQAGTTAFVKFVNRQGSPVDEVVLCERLMETTGVMLVPGGRCFGESVDFKGYVRVGYVPEREVLERGLAAWRVFMREEYEKLPIV
ncbi:aspartate/tyrosine/aromatic aminotransferase [Aspergillus japonicus CBS 114.51]|uniref:Aspartate/tyrosine/aromatic aminotransferase n=2 Tax=Aspergillus TaxID=5052 RepID=A0A2V5HGS5_ASPV1|nr:aspartate/tyrosine/aromatic aminotransferase [Aspergillus japonicus CBS 114.51]PYI21014.1 aspartate/tyrosine/aromatic aminotransferase [Aspergillus violaceofuscus CBS 115571]RAH87660.1 aspartate/tyrosine/aromatic aminotransferase [Aspergillus japonicus CBS 114.51]